MKKLLLFVMLTIACNVSAEITTQKKADQFFDQYCIALVNDIEKAVEKQKLFASDKDREAFTETSLWIVTLADVYDKLCKK